MKTTLSFGLALLAQSAWAADICEPLREQIEVQIAATGKSGFAVMVVDADADVAGKVVGTCARGARKLVYVQTPPARGRWRLPRPRDPR
jgi:ketosteroid isomerase-like protein